MHCGIMHCKFAKHSKIGENFGKMKNMLFCSKYLKKCILLSEVCFIIFLYEKCFFMNVYILIYSRNIHLNVWELVFENFKRKFLKSFLVEFWFLKFRIFISLSSPVWWKSARTSTSLRCKFFSRNAMSIKKIGDVADI